MHHQRGDFSINGRLILLAALALIIGVVAAFAAKFLLLMIAFFTNLFYYARFSIADARPSDQHWGYLFIFVPVVGALIIGLMARFGSEKIRGHGIPEALEAILFGKSIMSPKVAVLKPISSGISIGSGGPFGAEGPIIMTGGALGSLISQCFSVTASERKTLLAAGAAAGMSAVFATPIAAVLLAGEVLLFEWKPRSLVPVALASAVACLVRVHLLGEGPLFPTSAQFVLSESVFLQAVVAGVVAGLFSAVLSKTLYSIEDAFHKLPIHWMWWPAIGGLAVGLGGYFEPRALGVGYDLIAGFLQGNLGDPARLFLVKAAVWILALASGTSGGVLAPLLIFGCSLGNVESRLFGGLSSASWSLLSMGAIMGGMMRAPFTAILFSFELTRNADSLLPLLVACFASYGVTVLLMKRSILTEKIARRGLDTFCEYYVDPLERVTLSQVMSKDPLTVQDNLPLSWLLKEGFGRAGHTGYPVINSAKELVGLVTSSDVARIPALDNYEELLVKDLIQDTVITAFPFETCKSAADKMALHRIGRLPVVDPANPLKLIGIVTRSDLLKARHRHFVEEVHQERILFIKEEA